MKKIKPLIIAASMLMLNSGIVSADSNGKHSEAEKALAAASAQYKMALKSGFAWTATGKLLKKAQKAIDKGDMKAAAKLTSKALAQANGSLAQAKDSAEHWQDYIPKN